jgi:hypothetical protein
MPHDHPLGTTGTASPAGPTVPRRRVRVFPPRESIRAAVHAFHRGDVAHCEALLGALLARHTRSAVPVAMVPRGRETSDRRLRASEPPEDVAWALVEVAWIRLRQGEHAGAGEFLARCLEDLEVLHEARSSA